MNERLMPEPIEQRIIDRMITSIGTIWRHRNGNLYIVTQISNRENNRAGSPCTVVYERIFSGEPYSRPAIQWHESFTFFAEKAPVI